MISLIIAKPLFLFYNSGMIPLNQEQRLGRAAYLYIASRKMTASLSLLLVAAVLLVTKGGISALIVGPLSLAGVHAPSAAALSILNWITIGLFLIALLACLVGIIMARMEYANYTFTFEEFDMKLKRGILSLTEVSIPYRSMQDINVERNLMHRFSKTSRVVIDSAGQEEPGQPDESEIVLDPIEKGAAEDIRLMLQRKIGVQVVKGEKEADKEALAESA